MDFDKNNSRSTTNRRGYGELSDSSDARLSLSELVRMMASEKVSTRFHNRSRINSRFAPDHPPSQTASEVFLL